MTTPTRSPEWLRHYDAAIARGYDTNDAIRYADRLTLGSNIDAIAAEQARRLGDRGYWR